MKMLNLKPFSLIVFFLAPGCEKIFIKTYSIESRCVIGPENILFAGAFVHLSLGLNFTCCGSKGVKGFG